MRKWNCWEFTLKPIVLNLCYTSKLFGELLKFSRPGSHSIPKISECLGVGYKHHLKGPCDFSVQQSLRATSQSSSYTAVIWCSILYSMKVHSQIILLFFLGTSTTSSVMKLFVLDFDFLFHVWWETDLYIIPEAQCTDFVHEWGPSA